MRRGRPDPFDGKPLQLKPAKDALLIYSFGPDMLNNRGAAYDRKECTGDIVLRLPVGKP